MPTILHSAQEAADRLREGCNVALPTETVYGLAGLVSQEAAVRNIFALKNRPQSHPLIMHIAPDWDIRQWVSEVPEYAQKLIDNCWPGPLTLVLPCRTEVIPALVNAGQDSIALRVPSHPLTLEVLRLCKGPIVAPSANPFGKVSPTTAEHVAQSFADTSLYILDGGRCKVGIESTIVSALHPKSWRILRPGMLDVEKIQELTGLAEVVEEDATKVPGRLPQHYQPNTPLYYFDSQEALERFYHSFDGELFLMTAHKPAGHPEHLYAAFPEDPQQAAWALYYQLRIADESSAQGIIICLPEDSEKNQGIRERIKKAGQAPV